jgi:HKD family nuclease
MGGWTFLNDSLWQMALLSVVSGGPNPTLLAHLESELKLAKPCVVGLASAYVSVIGADELLKIFNLLKTKECRLLAGIDGEITHPQALSMTRNAGWDVRIGKSFKGIFHPKLIVGGQKFDAEGKIEKSNFAYLGSGNLTRGGLLVNVECGFTSLVATEVALC